MLAQKADIIFQLQKEILRLQGFRYKASDDLIRPVLGPIDSSFPNEVFPMASIHEFLTQSAEDVAATSGFISCLLSSLMNKGGASVWIGPSQEIFPAALKIFNVEPDKIIFINSKKPKELLWLVEEALKCEGLAAVVGEVAELTFTASRRLQLAVEQSRVTGFLIRNNLRNINVNACTARWKISSNPSIIKGDIPGIGFPVWNVELLKIRNGKPGSWQMQWAYDKLHSVTDPIVLSSTEQRKTG
ncbi:MAG TPA: Error-prone repair protein ImuA [Chitinophagaceae bacterium]|jgi:protein ImuA|nr:Error-prone repair protein ImuA [Chitinophagaceae bacterium]